MILVLLWPEILLAARHRAPTTEHCASLGKESTEFPLCELGATS